MKIVNGLTAAFILAAAWSLPAYAQESCNNETLSGAYTSVLNGYILTGPLAGFDNGVVVSTFDGDGNFTSKDHVVLHGVQPAEEWRQTTGGTYTVNPDCTGRMQANFPNNQPPPRISYFAITNSGKQLNFVSGNSGVALSGVATRQEGKEGDGDHRR